MAEPSPGAAAARAAPLPAMDWAVEPGSGEWESIVIFISFLCSLPSEFL